MLNLVSHDVCCFDCNMADISYFNMCFNSLGAAVCSEDSEAAKVVNKFLAEEVARACKNNKTHNCFSSDLQAFKNSEHVTGGIKKGLKGLDTYEQVGC